MENNCEGLYVVDYCQIDSIFDALNELEVLLGKVDKELQVSGQEAIMKIVSIFNYEGI